MYRMLWLLLLAGCNNEIYVRDGVTDGDTFYLAERALSDDDPVLQSWVAYSLAKSACQLELGGDNPARASAFGCELTARKLLLERWEELRSSADQDDYLDALARVREAGHLDEYVVHFHGKRAWNVPAEVDLRTFHQWRRKHLRRHKPETRLIGSWGYQTRQPGE